MPEHPAIRYARMGWFVLPSIGKRGLFSHEHASNDPRKVAYWIRKYGSGIDWQVVCGKRSGILVVDVENLQGHGELGGLQRRHGQLPEGPMVLSGGRKSGYHLYLALPRNRELRSWARLGTQVEVRGNGHTITVPPSRTERAYTWVRAPWNVVLPPAPEWLLEMMAPRPEPERTYDPSAINHPVHYVQVAIEREVGDLAHTTEGGRNRRLYTAARNLLRLVDARAVDAKPIVQALLQGAEACGLVKDDGLEQCMKTIRSAATSRGVRV